MHQHDIFLSCAWSGRERCVTEANLRPSQRSNTQKYACPWHDGRFSAWASMAPAQKALISAETLFALAAEQAKPSAQLDPGCSTTAGMYIPCVPSGEAISKPSVYCFTAAWRLRPSRRAALPLSAAHRAPGRAQPTTFQNYRSSRIMAARLLRVSIGPIFLICVEIGRNDP
jgi:hypothetical protein